MKKCTKDVVVADYKFKIILIGESGAGKTSILLKFTENKFNEHHLPTIGVDFKSKWLQFDKKSIKLQIWDTAGQERFKSITRSYYKNWHGWLAVYDVTDQDSFEKVQALIEYYKSESEASLPFNIVLVGNKWDLEVSRKVTYDKGKELSEMYGIQFFETSVKSDINIDEAFFTVWAQAIQDGKKEDNKMETKIQKLHQDMRKKKTKNDGCW